LNWQPPTDAYNVAVESRPDFLVLQSKLDQSNGQRNFSSVKLNRQ